MSTPQSRYSKEEFAHRGDELYEREIRPISVNLRPCQRRLVAIVAQGCTS